MMSSKCDCCWGRIGTSAQGRVCPLQPHVQARKQAGTALALPFNLLDQRHSHITSRGTVSRCLLREQPRLTLQPSGIFVPGQANTARARSRGPWERLPCPCRYSCGGSLLGPAMPPIQMLVLWTSSHSLLGSVPRSLPSPMRQPHPQTACNTALPCLFPPLCPPVHAGLASSGQEEGGGHGSSL